MTKVQLQHPSLFSIVDDEDFDLIKNYHWVLSVRGYVVGYLKNIPRKGQKLFYLHHVVLGKHDKRMHVDHIDRDPLNNKKNNLRVCTNPQNLMNRPKNKNNTSGYKGVVWLKREKKWRAGIKKNRLFISVGTFETKEDAARAYNKKAKELFGEFAFQNLVC